MNPTVFGNMEALMRTDLKLPGLKKVYHGKVRDVYFLEDGRLVLVATDRISAFDVILPRGIPYKGQVLSQLSWFFLKRSKQVAPNWALASPHPNVVVGLACEPVKVEMVVRAYLAGHAWRVYRDGGRELCGVELPDGLKENDRLPVPIITPSTKADEGHDEDITRAMIIEQGLASESTLCTMEQHALDLFRFGSVNAARQGLILVDTKYEFGLYNGGVMLMDEVHTPDSSRYFHANGYQERQDKGLPQEQLSKEFVRQWLIDNAFMGKEGQHVPAMPDAFVKTVSERYIALYEQLTGRSFEQKASTDLAEEIEASLLSYL